MRGSAIALDTTRAIDVLNDTEGAGAWVRAFTPVYLPVPVVGELLFGALNSSRPKENLERVRSLIEACEVLTITEKTAQVYAHLRLSLKRKGKPIPENDLWIAAICMEHNIALATSDRHFLEVEGLSVVLF
ncbi:MAG: hypothetical protein YPKNTGVA_000836 [Candidatus Fervidibacter sp.]|jgi:tRNA(fMet)-specific endonuclease VapC